MTKKTSDLSITNFISIVRQAFESSRCKSLYIGFTEFPAGSCMDASIILGNLLHKYLQIESTLISAQKNNPFGTHSWLQYEDCIIDITIDQFISETKSFIFPRNAKSNNFYDQYSIVWERPVMKQSLVPFASAYFFVDDYVSSKINANGLR